MWDSSAEYFAHKGIVYVGVTNNTTSIDFLTAGCRGRCGPAAGPTEAFAECVEARARCRACLAFEGIDAVDADCDEFDDGVGGNRSCENG